jgi:hypothetical protein
MEIAIMVGLTAIVTVVLIGVICFRLDKSADENDLKGR